MGVKLSMETTKVQIGHNRVALYAAKHKAYYTIVGLIIVLIFLRNTMLPSLPLSPIILGLVAFASIVLSIEENIAMAISFTVMTSAFQYKYALLILIIVCILRDYKNTKISKQHIPAIALIIWELLHAFIGTFSLIEYFRGFCELILLLYLFTVNKRKLDYKLMFRSFALCTVAIGLIRFYIQISHYGFNMDSFWRSFYRFGELENALSTYGLSSNENTWGFVCVLSTVAMLQLISRRQYTGIDLALMIASVILGSFSISRTYLVLMATVVLLYFISTLKTLKSTFKGILWLLVIITGLLILINTAFPTVLSNFAMRLNLADSSGARFELYQFYNNHIFSNPANTLFGIGMQDLLQKVHTTYSSSINVPHNGIQEILVMWGIPGLLLILPIFTGIFVESKRNGRATVLQLMPIIIVIVNTLGGQFFRNGTTMMALCMGYLALFYPNIGLNAIAEKR